MQRDNGTSPGESPERSDDGTLAARPRRLRFGEFRFDPESLELSGRGRTVRLQPQPARLLELLIAHPGAVVSREAVRRHLWPDRVHVEYDQSMNSCVKRIRIALGDSADTPEYIETLPRLGYRFLKPVSEIDDDDDEPEPSRGGAGRRSRPFAAIALAALGAVLGVVATILVWRALDSEPSSANEPPRPVLVVLPFTPVETWSGADSFREGLEQELITSLGRQASDRLAVVSRDLRPFTGAGGRARRILADYLLDGRVQRQQGRLRVWARLLLADDGTVLWTESYEGAESDILVFGADVGSRIADEVVTQLVVMEPSS
ncbi:MAG: winged helix-turn-helix domain-containing protein [Acidobacteria bacterium]|nr:winged helix-turn-helix domain-containing protein [Acidobacteriota bacterium]